MKGRQLKEPHLLAVRIKMMTPQKFGEAFQNGGYQPTVRFLQKRGVDKDQAIEIAQAAWTKGWERISQLRDDNLLVEWVNTLPATHLRRASAMRALLICRRPAANTLSRLRSM